MTWNVRTDVSQEEVYQYAEVVFNLIEREKGWRPGEYRIRLIAALSDAPLAAFNAIHNDGLKDLEENPPKEQGTHPLEVQVYVHTGEMRAFTDSEEFSRIWKEAQQKAGK